MKIDVDAIEDDDVVESTASSFDRVSSLLLLLLLLLYPTITIHVCPLSCSSILALRSNTLFLQPQREQRWCLDDNMRPGPIPGSKPASSSSSSKASEQKPESKPFKVKPNYQKRNKLKALKLLCSRELSGSLTL
ncbi:unnamed protein product [Brassica rapa]|uniref:Uncharacterized protein n=1 Tax=Brassica campestris TaxID=3711 RepID=A0A8D9CWI3_BRACM|nr:unnamed protein product [Brassica rapa]